MRRYRPFLMLFVLGLITGLCAALAIVVLWRADSVVQPGHTGSPAKIRGGQTC